MHPPSTPQSPFRQVTTAIVVFLLLGSGLAACGDSDDEPNGQQGVQESSLQSKTGTGDSAAANDEQLQEELATEVSSASLTGNLPQARKGVVSLVRVYDGIDEAIKAGAGATDVAVGDTFENADGNESLTAICDLMSKPLQRQTIIYAKRSAGLADVEWTCERAMAIMLRRSKGTGGLSKTRKATVVGVNAEGDRATATVRLGGPRASAKTISLLKEDGRWKLGTAPKNGGERLPGTGSTN